MNGKVRTLSGRSGRAIALVGIALKRPLADFRAGRVGRKQSFMTHEVMQNELLRYLDAMLLSREQRLASVTASILRVLCYVA